MVDRRHLPQTDAAAAGTCDWCQTSLPEAAQFCPNCGEPVTEPAQAGALAVSTAVATAPTVVMERGGRLRITDELRRRLLEAARRELGEDGDTILWDITRLALNIPFEEITYAELPHLLIAMHQAAPALAGRDPANDLAGALESLRLDFDVELRQRLIDNLQVSLGPAAEPFIVNVCAGVDLDFQQISISQLPLIAAATERAGAIFGPALARSLAATIEGAARVPDVADRIVAVATERLGPEGDALIRDLSREHLGKDLNDLHYDDITPLIHAVRNDGPVRIGAARTASFIAAARYAVVNPSNAARAPLVQVVNREMGPAGEIFLKKTCSRHGLPFEAVSYEHIPWLAGVLRRESAPLLGETGAERLAVAVERLRPDGASRKDR